MGEMSLRNRRAKDVAASFNRLRCMVDDIKGARKSLSAHHRLMADFVSYSLSSAVPSSSSSSKPSSPRNPPCHLQLDDLQEVGNGSIPFYFAPPSRKPAVSAPNVTLAGPPNLQQTDDLQDVGSPSLVLQGSIPSPVSLPVANSSLCVSATKISALPIPPSMQNGSRSALLCKDGEDADDCASDKISVSFYQWIVVDPGKSVLWAFLLLVFLCFFLFMGKEVAVGFTTSAYFVLWLIFRGQSFSEKIPRFLCSAEFHPQAAEGIGQNRSNGLILSSSASRSSARSEALPMVDGCAQGEIPTEEPCFAIDEYAPSLSTGARFARLKPGVMLVLALCGLAYGQIMAVCMCSCCILMASEMQRLAWKRCKQGTQYNT